MKFRKKKRKTDLSEEERASIVSRLRNGDKKAFDEIYYALQEASWCYASRYVPVEDCHEITHDAFIKLWECREKFYEWKHVAGFLFTTVRFSCLKKLRNENSKHQKQKAYLLYQLTALSEVDSEIHDQVLELGLRDAINTKLSGKIQKTMQLSLAGYTIKEIAHQLNITKQTVQNYRSLAYAQLRDYLV